MCSSAGDIEDISNCSREVQNTINKELLQKCKKCPEKSTVLLQKKDPFCNSCFFEYCNHKFRSTIGKSKKIRHGEKVLLACSGGRKSAALLHLTQQTLKSASMKQISFSPAIIFIDESFLKPPAKSDPNPDELLILKQLKETGYPVLYSSLEMVHEVYKHKPLYSTISSDFKPDVPLVNEALRSRVNENFEDMELSSKMDLLKHLRLLLITEIAKQAHYQCVFLGDTAFTLAMDLLSDMALGRGSQISSDTSFWDTRYKVPLCRPMREFSNKEIALYNHMHGTECIVFPDFLSKTSPRSSIQRLTESFISNLNESFPATISTIFKTGGKLSKNNVHSGTRTCTICRSDLDNVNSDFCSALEALKISHKLSSASGALEKQSEAIHTLRNLMDAAGHLSTCKKMLFKKDMMQSLCHGCSITFQSLAKPEYFQTLIPDISNVQMTRDEMREEIKDFILEENDC